MLQSSHGRYQGVPDLIYGTAFKFESTDSLVESAISVGFRAIDTASNRPQYREDLVGKGIAVAISSGESTRAELWIQTKFSPYKVGKPADSYPYDITKPIIAQVQQSVESSLARLGVNYLDCIVLHSLYPDIEDTLTVWRALETLVPSKVTHLSLSNTDLQSLHRVWEAATIKPISVQNRFTGATNRAPDSTEPPGIPYPEVPYDRDIRAFCRDHDIWYAPWGLLWGNPGIMDEDPDRPMHQMAADIGMDLQTTMYACMKEVCDCKLSILCGTTKELNMSQRVTGPEKLREYLEESGGNRTKWEALVEHVRRIVNE